MIGQKQATHVLSAVPHQQPIRRIETPDGTVALKDLADRPNAVKPRTIASANIRSCDDRRELIGRDRRIRLERERRRLGERTETRSLG